MKINKQVIPPEQLLNQGHVSNGPSRTKPSSGDNTPTQLAINSAEKNLEALKTIYSDKDLKKLGLIECQTCANRTYVDGSDDPGVSFKTPTQLDPSEAASMVMAHEMEHVVNEQAHAEKEGREVIAQSVSIHTSTCPECGINYVSGGVTKTTTKKKSDYGLSKEMTKGLKFDSKQ